MDLYQVIHSSPEVKTVYDYCNQIDSVAFKYVQKISEFLNIVGEDNITNLDRILASYTTVDEKNINGQLSKSPSLQGQMLLKVGTKLFIPISEVERVGLLTQGIEVVSSDTAAFKASKIAELEGDENYYKKFNPITGQEQLGVFKDIYPDATVWLWCRSLSNTYDRLGGTAEMSGEIFDITPFVEQLQTSNTKNGGNFSITLPPLVCELKTETDSLGRTNSRYIVKKKSLKTYTVDNIAGKDQEYIAQGSILSDDMMKRSHFLFHTIINENDVVFIRFETLEIEKEQRYKDSGNFYIDKANLAGRIYDMIGLVDTNSQNINSETNDVTTVIQGRDLMKLFIDDGTYFYALENSQGQLKLAGGSTADNEWLQRVYSDNSLYYLSLYFNTSIENILKFIIQQLANIKITPDDLFSSYGDRVNSTYTPIDRRVIVGEGSKEYTEDRGAIKKTKIKGIWQIVKLVIDESVVGRRLIDASMSSANGSLLNFIRKACQEPFVEFYSDTYGDEFYLIVRKPPYDKKSVISLIEGTVQTEKGSPKFRPVIIDIESEDIISEQLEYDGDNTFSWYHFTPQNVFFGDSSTYSLVLTPAIYFKEYAEIWGSKPLDIVHNYTPYYSSAKSEIGDMSYYQEQTVKDLKFLVDSHCYLPFTRKGTLVLNGDRRYKKGNIIRYKPTGEIFFIDAVTQKISISESTIDRVSTLSVSRGMMEDFIYGVDINGMKNVSYFNIINTELTLEKRTDTEEYFLNGVKKTRKVSSLNNELIFSKFRVNTDIFNFFLRREQFLAKDYTKTNIV